MTELRETERSLLELTVTLPAAQRTRAVRARQVGLLTAEQVQQPAITVIRAKGTTNVKYDAAVDFLLQPGDVVQVGSLFPPVPELPLDQFGVSREKTAQSEAPSRTGDATAARRGRRWIGADAQLSVQPFSHRRGHHMTTAHPTSRERGDGSTITADFAPRIRQRHQPDGRSSQASSCPHGRTGPLGNPIFLAARDGSLSRIEHVVGQSRSVQRPVTATAEAIFGYP